MKPTRTKDSALIKILNISLRRKLAASLNADNNFKLIQIIAPYSAYFIKTCTWCHYCGPINILGKEVKLHMKSNVSLLLLLQAARSLAPGTVKIWTVCQSWSRTFVFALRPWTSWIDRPWSRAGTRVSHTDTSSTETPSASCLLPRPREEGGRCSLMMMKWQNVVSGVDSLWYSKCWARVYNKSAFKGLLSETALGYTLKKKYPSIICADMFYAFGPPYLYM